MKSPLGFGRVLPFAVAAVIVLGNTQTSHADYPCYASYEQCIAENIEACSADALEVHALCTGLMCRPPPREKGDAIDEVADGIIGAVVPFVFALDEFLKDF